MVAQDQHVVHVGHARDHLVNSIVSVILIDMLIFDVPLGVIVEKQQIITSPMVDVKNEILHALDQRQNLM